MKPAAIKTAVIFLILTSALAAGAIPPAYDGPLGNPEEPAMRPYKWLFRGVLSLLAQPVIAFKEGNMKTPVLGSVEVVRGLRRGAIELDESIVRGLVFAPPPPPGSWKQMGYVNTFLEEDPFLAYLADFLAGGYPYGLKVHGAFGLDFIGNVTGAAKAGEDAVELSAKIFAVQQVVDLVPIYGKVDRDMIESRAEETRFNRGVARTLREPLETDRQRAQRMYIGERATINKKTELRGNVLRAVR